MLGGDAASVGAGTAGLRLAARQTAPHSRAPARGLTVSSLPCPRRAAQDELEEVLFAILRKKGYGDEYVRRYQVGGPSLQLWQAGARRLA